MERRPMFFSVFIVGFVLACAVTVAIYTVAKVQAVDAARVQDRRTAERDIATVARRVFRIERPSPTETRTAIISALKFCEQDTVCRLRFIELGRGERTASPTP